MKLFVALVACIAPFQASAALVLSPDGATVYDTVNNITWLADFNLAATNQFGLPLCNGFGVKTCVNASGSMNYASATAWVAAMNTANYLGHNNWQLPTTPLVDKTCAKTGPNGGSFGYGCTAGALDTAYSAVGLKPPNTAVPIPNNTVGPFSNFQPYLYWSQSNAGQNQGNATFSFATGWQGANTLPNFLYLLPMIQGKIPGTPPATGNGLQVNPDKQTVFDPITNITWVANANLAATNPFGLPACKDPTTPAICVNQDGAMTWDSAVQFIANMNSAAYLGQTDWQAPAVDASCTNYNCAGTKNPMGNLFYGQLGFSQGMTVVTPPNIAVGPFHNIQPYLYWTCQAATIQGACEADGPAPNFEWSYSFGSGFQGTDLLANNLYVTAYFVGSRAPATAPPPQIGSDGIVNNASYAGSVTAPGEIAAIFGTNLTDGTSCLPPSCNPTFGSNGKLNTTMAGAQVTVNQTPVPIFYATPGQLGIQIPFELTGTSAAVVVSVGGQASAPAAINLGAVSPGIFSATADGKGAGAITHANGAAVTPQNPAQAAEVVIFYATGFGQVAPPVATGALPAGVSSTVASVTLNIGGITVVPEFAGLAGCCVGLNQINARIPAGVNGGDAVPVVLNIGGKSSNMATIAIQNLAPPPPGTFYIAPNGNDSWSGMLPNPNSSNTDGPFATFDRARAAVESLNKAGLTRVVVQFRAGTYFLPATEQFTAADSGTANTQNVYQNYPGESPVISGGVRVQNWTNVGGDMWKATLPASTQYFQNLFYNGVRRLRPRLGGSLGTYFRNAGPIYLNAPGPPAKAPDPNCSVYFSGSGWECYDRFQYNPTDPIVNTWKNLAPPAGNHCGQPAGNAALVGDIELVNFEQYSVSKLRISCVDTANKIVYLTGVTATETDHPDAHGYLLNHRYLVENVQDQLTQPGQWFLDRSATPWTLTYLANPGENPNTDTVIVPQLTQVLVASSLQYVTFQGLTFAHDNYTMPAKGYDGTSDIIASVSFQNSRHITFDSSTVAETSGVGLEFISCIDRNSPNWCVSNNTAGVAANNLIENSAFYDMAAGAIRIGIPGNPTDTNANVPQFNTVQNTVVEGYGRVYPGSKGIAQGQGHDNLYTHNDVYDGYKGAIKVCYCANSDVNPPFTNNNVISFNHVYNLFQGIMNDSGSIYFGVGTPSPPSSGTGNKMLNNKVHDVNDASVMDSDGYGGDGLYADDFSGQVDMENNLVYRVSGNAISFSGPRAGPNQSSTVKNNILAFARQSLVNSYDPYSFNTVPPLPMFFTATNNLFYFDRKGADSFYVEGGCTYAGEAFTAYEQWTSNLYWRTDGAFATDPQAFHVQQSLDAKGNCGNQKLWNYYTFALWQGLGEDAQSLVQNPGFNNPTYPVDDYTLPKGSPGVGFVVFDPSQAGRSNPIIKPPTVPATFPTKTFNPATDF